MALSCSVGTAVATGAVNYSATATSGGSADVTIDASGKYHVNIANPVTLEKTLVTGGGIPGAPNTYSLLVKNAYKKKGKKATFHINMEMLAFMLVQPKNKI